VLSDNSVASYKTKLYYAKGKIKACVQIFIGLHKKDNENIKVRKCLQILTYMTRLLCYYPLMIKALSRTKICILTKNYFKSCDKEYKGPFN
jgi:hypothetical protein